MYCAGGWTAIKKERANRSPGRSLGGRLGDKTRSGHKEIREAGSDRSLGRTGRVKLFMY